MSSATTRASSSLREELPPIPPVTVPEVTLDHIVRWTAAVGDFSPIHYDAERAAERGFDGPVVNGPWKSALVMQMLHDWAGPAGRVERLECRYERADLVGGSLEIAATVTATSREGADLVVSCDVAIENGQGQRTLTGTARVRLATIGARPTGDSESTLPLERLRRVLNVGEVSGRHTYRVDPNDVARFRVAVNGPAGVGGPPAVGDVAPPTFYAALDPVERRDLDPERALIESIGFAMTGGGNAFNEVTYDRPIRAGDEVTVTTTYSDVYVREGRSGTLLFRVRTNELLAADGEHIGTTRMGHVLAFDLGTSTGDTP
jgi:acyl dehydratase